MVYIVSHTWPNRWLKPGKKDSISVYSNCDEVELFNDVKTVSLGKKTRQGIGTHFQWDGVNVKYNVLYAVGYVNGNAVAQDYIVLNYLPDAPHLKSLTEINSSILKPAVGYKYLYRVNCGGPDYTDKQGNLWMADAHQTNKNTWGSTSWTDDYDGMPAFFGSQQRTFDVIRSTDDAQLFQSYRFGMNKLKYNFPVPDGDYKVELYFTESWYGIGGGMDCNGWRMFDVAVNNKIIIKDLDIWKEAGTDNALKKTVTVHVTGGQLQISFPHTAAGEAIISAVTISTLDHKVVSAPSSGGVIKELKADKQSKGSIQSWLDIGQQAYADADIHFSELPPALYGADWIKTSAAKSAGVSFTLAAASDIYVAMNVKPENRPEWLKDYLPTGLSLQTDENGGTDFALYKKRFPVHTTVVLGAYTDGRKYTVIVLPVTTLEPATDLKRSVNYGVANALVQGDGAVQDTLDKKKIIRFTKSSGGKVILGITPGVADSYALRFKYYNTSQKAYTVNMHLQAADGTIMKTEVLSFKPLTKGKSGTVSTTTGTSINAGNYKVILTAVDADGLIISGFEMQ